MANNWLLHLNFLSANFVKSIIVFSDIIFFSGYIFIYVSLTTVITIHDAHLYSKNKKQKNIKFMTYINSITSSTVHYEIQKLRNQGCRYNFSQMCLQAVVMYLQEKNQFFSNSISNGCNFCVHHILNSLISFSKSFLMLFSVCGIYMYENKIYM